MSRIRSAILVQGVICVTMVGDDDYLIVVGIAILSAVLLPYFLQGVDDDKPGVLVFPDKPL